MDPPNAELPPHRRAALDAYYALVESNPELFGPRPGRPLVLDPDELTAYARRAFAEDMNAPVVGVAARTPFHVFVTDVVRTPDGPQTYDRLIHVWQLQRLEGVAVVATVAEDFRGDAGRPGDVILVRQMRHATGQAHWEIPHGAGEPGRTGAEQAAAELREEAGFVGRHARRLATVHTNTGTTPETVAFYHVEVTGRVDDAPETAEVIVDARAWPVEAAWEAIRRGEITDAFTIQALAFLERLR